MLVRPIPGSPWHDALGCYPLAAVSRDADLKAGLERLRSADLVSVALVPDPLTSPSLDLLASAFFVCSPFKTHYLIDRHAGPIRFGATHRRWIRKALRGSTVTPIALGDVLDEWQSLYDHTMTRRGVTGIQNFTPAYFAALATMPEITALVARSAGRIVAMTLWVRDGDIAYYHLGASSPEGYDMQAMYGLVAAANEHLVGCRIIDLGGAAGVNDNPDDGLAYFKRGFANRKLTAYFCGSCLKNERYDQLAGNQPETSFFPAYRQP
jgi:hypothetical protein